jgi:hypothetical protein
VAPLIELRRRVEQPTQDGSGGEFVVGLEHAGDLRGDLLCRRFAQELPRCTKRDVVVLERIAQAQNIARRADGSRHTVLGSFLEAVR